MSQPNVSLALPFTRSLYSLLPALPFPFLPLLLPTVTNWARKMNAWCFVLCLFCLLRRSRCSSRPPLIATVEWTPSYIHEGMCAVPGWEPERQRVFAYENSKKYARFVTCYLCWQLVREEVTAGNGFLKPLFVKTCSYFHASSLSKHHIRQNE